MADVHNLDGLAAVVDGVPDSVLPAASAPMAIEGLTQRSSYPVGAFGQWPVQELHACCGDSFRQLFGELACRGTGDLYPVGHSG